MTAPRYSSPADVDTTAEPSRRLAQQIQDFVAIRPGTSFVELERQFSEDFGEGPYTIRLAPPHDQIVVWQGMTERALAALEILRRERRVIMEPTSVLVYIVDGKVLDLPTAKHPPKAGYKTARWVPTALYLWR